MNPRRLGLVLLGVSVGATLAAGVLVAAALVLADPDPDDEKPAEPEAVRIRVPPYSAAEVRRQLGVLAGHQCVEGTLTVSFSAEGVHWRCSVHGTGKRS